MGTLEQTRESSPSGGARAPSSDALAPVTSRVRGSNCTTRWRLASFLSAGSVRATSAE